MILFNVKRIRVKLNRNGYDVIIGGGLLRRAGRELRRIMPEQTRLFVVTSPTVRRHWGDTLEKSLRQARMSYSILEMNDGETAKRLETVEQLAEQMVAGRADRKSWVLAFGGGVVGDCAGFLAAVFLRGVPVVQIPTTLLAQVDASIGGKSGGNLGAGKNLVGAFHQPRAVLVDPELLSTLDEREFRAGLLESLKCGIIRDKKLFDFMREKAPKILGRDRKALERIIIDSVRVKAQVVSADEKESDLRRVLNYGHTIGHALEAATAYSQFLHGEAVGCATISGAVVAFDSGFCATETEEQIVAGVIESGPLPPLRCGAEEIVRRLVAGKKTVAGAVHFVLP